MGMIDDISYVKRYPVYFGVEHSSIHGRSSLIKESGIDTADTSSLRGCELFNPNTFMTFMWQLLPSSAIPVHADWTKYRRWHTSFDARMSSGYTCVSVKIFFIKNCTTVISLTMATHPSYYYWTDQWNANDWPRILPHGSSYKIPTHESEVRKWANSLTNTVVCFVVL